MAKIELIHGDCMDYMKGCEDNAFDLAIVDPPYGIGESGKTNASRGSAAGANKWKGTRNTTGAGVPSTKFEHKKWDREPPTAEYIAELRRVAKDLLIFGANHFIDRIAQNSSCWIVWDKQNDGSDFADCELAWTTFKGAVRVFRFRWNGMLQGNMRDKQIRIHPTQKPIQLYSWILRNYAEPGQRILDTHLGSGSSAIAAHYFGVDFVGIEIDEDYYKAACNRFDMETRQQALI